MPKKMYVFSIPKRGDKQLPRQLSHKAMVTDDGEPEKGESPRLLSTGENPQTESDRRCHGYDHGERRNADLL
jgi:hypothetical protein